MRSSLPALLLLLPLAACGGDFVAADDFAFSDEGWALDNQFPSTTMSIVEADVSGSAPFICGRDRGFSGGAKWRFRAPAKYSSGASRAFRQRLTWEQMTEFSAGRLYAENDVFLTGRGLTLIATVPDVPRGSRKWAPFFVYLDARTAWRKEAAGFPLATDDEIESVLKTLTLLALPGEWRDGEETSCIDNVYFGTP